MDEKLSYGKKLFQELNIKQGTFFKVKHIPKDKRKKWNNHYVIPSLRESSKRILKDSSIFLTLSQDCDIACNKDQTDNTVEFAVCKNIKQSEVFKGNSFVHSVRKLHFKAGDEFYEASVEHIFQIEKCELYETIKDIPELNIEELQEKTKIQVPLWRANRYNRSALPDSFNLKLKPILGKYLDNLDKTAQVEQCTDGLSSYINGLYIYLNSSDELESYTFEFFALLIDKISDDKMSQIQDLIEKMAEELVNSANYIDDSSIYADRFGSTYVSYIQRLTRLNLDYVSLENGDSDLNPLTS